MCIHINFKQNKTKDISIRLIKYYEEVVPTSLNFTQCAQINFTKQEVCIKNKTESFLSEISCDISNKIFTYEFARMS